MYSFLLIYHFKFLLMKIHKYCNEVVLLNILQFHLHLLHESLLVTELYE